MFKIIENTFMKTHTGITGIDMFITISQFCSIL